MHFWRVGGNLPSVHLGGLCVAYGVLHGDV